LRYTLYIIDHIILVISRFIYQYFITWLHHYNYIGLHQATEEYHRFHNTHHWIYCRHYAYMSQYIRSYRSIPTYLMNNVITTSPHTLYHNISSPSMSYHNVSNE
jgi:hypothetical protein